MLKKIKSKIALTILLVSIVLILPLIQTQTTPDNEKSISDFLSTDGLEEFRNMPGSDKIGPWEDSKNPTDSSQATANRLARKTIVTNIVDKISETKAHQQNLARIANPSIPEPTEIESIIGLENLEWSSEGKNVIGDKNVWLDLDKIPQGVAEIEYKNGEFILRDKKGLELIIEAQATNTKGEATGLGTYDEGENKDKPIALEDFDFLLEKGKTGKVKLTSEGFKLEGEAKLKFKDLTFQKHPEYERTAIVKIHSEKHISAIGIETIKEGVVKVNPFYPGDGTNQEKWIEYDVVLGDKKVNAENIVRINKKDIQAKGLGSIDVLGNLDSLEVEGDYFIQNGDMPLRIKGKEIYGPRKGQFVNQDKYITEFSLGNPKKRFSFGLGLSGSAYTTSDYTAFESEFDFQTQDGKITAIKEAGGEWVNFNDPRINEFLSENPKLKSLIGSIKNVNQENAMDIVRRFASQQGYNIGNDKYNEPTDIRGAHTIDEIISTLEPSQIFTVRPPKESEGIGTIFEGSDWFTAGTKISTHWYAGETAKTILRIIEDPNSARAFSDVKTIPEFLRKLDQSEFKLTTETIYEGLDKETMLEKIKEGLIEKKVSVRDAEEFRKYLSNQMSDMKNSDLMPVGTLITSYWYPSNDIEGRKPYFGVTIPGKPEKPYPIDEKIIELYKKSLLIGADFVQENPEDVKKIIKWCQTIGSKVGVCE